jgi:hypothetical protein
VSGLLCWRDFHPLEWQLASLHWPGRAQRLICWSAAGEALRKEHAMRTSQKTPDTMTTIGMDLGKHTFHLVGTR